MKTDNKIISFIKIVLGISMLVAVLIGYMPIPEYLVEFTCISNSFGGMLLITDGILKLKGKSVPGLFYRNIAVGIFFVYAGVICSFIATVIYTIQGWRVRKEAISKGVGK